jgi:hypothetical protein
MKLLKRLIFLSVFAMPAAALVPDTGPWTAPTPQVDLSPTPKNVRAYPNPWRSDRHTGHFVTFDRLGGQATVKIFTVSAQHVKTLQTTGDSVSWDLTNDQGGTVASGLYLYLITTDTGAHLAGKLAVIR